MSRFGVTTHLKKPTTSLKIMIDYKKLSRIGLDSGDQTKVDTVLNVDHRPLISQYNDRFIKYGFVKVKDHKYILNMSKRERDIFQITQNIAGEELGFAYGVIGKLLSDKTEEDLRKEIDLLRDREQIEQLEHEKISKSHQKLNGELREDNKKLTRQINDFLDKKVNGLRKGGM
tara:strand:+ start:143 stop:661 length:519 start_codon:yes stop_codon:yes gene_type:complete